MVIVIVIVIIYIYLSIYLSIYLPNFCMAKLYFLHDCIFFKFTILWRFYIGTYIGTLVLQPSSWCCGYTAAGDLSAMAASRSTDASQITVGGVIGNWGFSQTRSIPALQPLTEGRCYCSQETHENTRAAKLGKI